MTAKSSILLNEDRLRGRELTCRLVWARPNYAPLGRQRQDFEGAKL
jgi:hypothetical protein